MVNRASNRAIAWRGVSIMCPEHQHEFPRRALNWCFGHSFGLLLRRGGGRKDTPHTCSGTSPELGPESSKVQFVSCLVAGRPEPAPNLYKSVFPTCDAPRTRAKPLQLGFSDLWQLLGPFQASTSRFFRLVTVSRPAPGLCKSVFPTCDGFSACSRPLQVGFSDLWRLFGLPRTSASRFFRLSAHWPLPIRLCATAAAYRYVFTISSSRLLKV